MAAAAPVESTPNMEPSVETPAPMTSPPAANEGGAAQPFHSASLYVGDLAPDVNEGLLFEIFNAVGPVASIRVCRDAVTRRSLGYCYINFHQMADAERALDTMNYTMIKSRPCRIMWSQRDPSIRRSGVGNIFVKNLHESIDNKQLYDTFSLFGNILSCKVVTNRDSGSSAGYGYVHYETAEAANAAIEKLDGMLIDGQEVQVGHFMKKNDRPGEADWTNCYVKGIPSTWDDAKLKEEFEKYGEIISATIRTGVKKIFKKKVVPAADPDKAEEKSDDKEEPKPEEEAKEEKAEGDETEETEEKEEVKEEPKEKVEEEPKIVSLGFGFVSFLEHESAVAACENLNGKEFKVTVDDEEKTIELFVGRAQKKSERARDLRSKFESMKMERISKYQGVNLYIKNLDDSVTDDILREEFSTLGTITSARVMKDMKDGRSRGFGFVCYSTPEEATRSVNEMNGKIINGKPIFVALAQRKEVRRAQLENIHNTRGPGGGQGGNPNSGMIRGPMGPMGGYPNGAVPVYMNRPGVQPMYPMMPGMMGANGAGGRGGQPNRGYPMMQQQRYPMPAYGAIPQPGRGGRIPGGQPGRGGRGGRVPGGQPMGRGPVPGRGGAPQQQLKFNQQARNANVPPANVPPPANSAPPAQPAPLQANETLTLSALASASPEMQKNMIGERLYPLIHASQPELAGKITGMLLEMDNSELLHLLESPEALNAKIAEALQVLEAHNTSEDQKS